ncbi:hypothetical protein RvVAT039_04400 [Agrobacterium vitis]|uniref:ArsR family transcriptional regulator n=2 Tax=Rhizobium/Agrobacterium group TaxID=227290 RepID=B9JYE1_ALLAM|nr:MULTISPECIES: hypothetical protein [Rhizobium/Agrobacterium group]ACM37171.1 hypothetical protein Avi_3010 [Allorhizobium ampelinum S4]MCF1446639.1 hypothetical protein [Allorhizobium ampelinum]MCF1485072.1 hypothetical protein [Allorhizobium ampelinum]MCF1492486.1 hypothetical protein [Allorhizobium ampelinum]MUO30011.1 hypothetical protein [Agrobacterium vitis]
MNSIAVDYEKLTREKARLVILQELAKQTNESLSSPFFDGALRLSAIYQDLPWVNQQIEYLRNLSAVKVLDVDEDVKIATLTDHGKRHLDREITIQGVQRPRRPGI